MEISIAQGRTCQWEFRLDLSHDVLAQCSGRQAITTSPIARQQIVATARALSKSIANIVNQFLVKATKQLPILITNILFLWLLLLLLLILLPLKSLKSTTPSTTAITPSTTAATTMPTTSLISGFTLHTLNATPNPWPFLSLEPNSPNVFPNHGALNSERPPKP